MPNSGTVRLAPVTNMRETWRTIAVFSASGPTMKPGVSQSETIGGLPIRHGALEIGQVFLRNARRLLLVLDEDVDDAIGRLERDRTDLGRMIDAEAAAFDHGGAAHADRGVLGGDDDIAASEHRGIAGEAIAGDDS